MIFNLNKFLLNIKNITIFILFCVFNFSAYGMENDSNFRKVEATGRAVLVDGNIDISRKRALEDALYIAALKGGANVNGFSSIGKNTVINDQAIVTAASRVIDFKIVKEIQEKEFLSIKISAIVGGNLSTKNCRIRPINVSVFKGELKIGSDVPSNLSRKMSLWFTQSYDIISKKSNVNVIDYRTQLIDKVIKSNVNSSFDYNALTNGIPYVQSGDYSLVPNLTLTKNNFEVDNFSNNYLFEISFKIYKGSNFKLLPIKTYNFPIRYNFNSKFKFLQNISRLNINSVDEMIKNHVIKVTKNLFQGLHCRPLEGKLSFINGELKVDIGSN